MPVYSLKLDRLTTSTAPMVKLVSCRDIEWKTLPSLQVGDQVTVKHQKGVIERIDGDFYTISNIHGHFIVAHYSDISPLLSDVIRSPKHWLIDRDIVVIHDSVWKGFEGRVKEVTSQEMVLVQISSHSVFHTNTLQTISMRNIALDLRTTS